MNSAAKYSHSILLELIRLRNGLDKELFMDKLYEALSSEFRGLLDPDTITKEHRLALSVMIEHYLQKEEYEKCAALQKYL